MNDNEIIAHSFGHYHILTSITIFASDTRKSSQEDVMEHLPIINERVQRHPPLYGMIMFNHTEHRNVCIVSHTPCTSSRNDFVAANRIMYFFIFSFLPTKPFQNFSDHPYVVASRARCPFQAALYAAFFVVCLTANSRYCTFLHSHFCHIFFAVFGVR